METEEDQKEEDAKRAAALRAAGLEEKARQERLATDPDAFAAKAALAAEIKEAYLEEIRLNNEKAVAQGQGAPVGRGSVLVVSGESWRDTNQEQTEAADREAIPKLVYEARTNNKYRDLVKALVRAWFFYQSYQKNHTPNFLVPLVLNNEDVSPEILNQLQNKERHELRYYLCLHEAYKKAHSDIPLQLEDEDKTTFSNRCSRVLQELEEDHVAFLFYLLLNAPVAARSLVFSWLRELPKPRPESTDLYKALVGRARPPQKKKRPYNNIFEKLEREKLSPAELYEELYQLLVREPLRVFLVGVGVLVGSDTPMIVQRFKDLINNAYVPFSNVLMSYYADRLGPEALSLNDKVSYCLLFLGTRAGKSVDLRIRHLEKLTQLYGPAAVFSDSALCDFFQRIMDKCLTDHLVDYTQELIEMLQKKQDKLPFERAFLDSVLNVNKNSRHSVSSQTPGKKVSRLSTGDSSDESEEKPVAPKADDFTQERFEALLGKKVRMEEVVAGIDALELLIDQNPPADHQRRYCEYVQQLYTQLSKMKLLTPELLDKQILFLFKVLPKAAELRFQKDMWSWLEAVPTPDFFSTRLHQVLIGFEKIGKKGREYDHFFKDELKPEGTFSKKFLEEDELRKKLDAHFAWNAEDVTQSPALETLNRAVIVQALVACYATRARRSTVDARASGSLASLQAETLRSTGDNGASTSTAVSSPVRSKK